MTTANEETEREIPRPSIHPFLEPDWPPEPLDEE